MPDENAAGLAGEGRAPRALRIVAGLFVLYGVAAIAEMLIRLTQGHLLLAFGALGVFIGPGLLRGSRTWRVWALVFCWMAAVVAPVFIVWLAVAGGPVEQRLLGIPTGMVPWPVAFVLGHALFALTIWELHVLLRPDVRAWFHSEPSG